MEQLYDYIIDNYTLSAEAKRMLDNILIWADERYADDETLEDNGVHFLWEILSSSIGIEEREIRENWG